MFNRPNPLMLRGLLWVQGAYFQLTGIWPLVSIRSFKMVTGEKYDNLPSGLDVDHWLVMAVGVLVTSIGLSCCCRLAGQRPGRNGDSCGGRCSGAYGNRCYLRESPNHRTDLSGGRCSRDGSDRLVGGRLRLYATAAY
jgi:hypothetical protein